jgi:hypothetical protein
MLQMLLRFPKPSPALRNNPAAMMFVNETILVERDAMSKAVTIEEKGRARRGTSHVRKRSISDAGSRTALTSIQLA